MNSSADIHPVRRAGFVDLVYSTFALYWRRLPLLAAISAIIWIPAFALQLLIAFALQVPGHIQSVRPGSSGNGAAALTLTAYLLLTLAIVIAAVVWSQGSLVRGALDHELSGRAGVMSAVESGRATFWRLLGLLALLTAITLAVELLVVVVFLVVLFLAGIAGGVGQLRLIAFMFLVVAIAPLVVFTRFVPGIGAVVAERVSPVNALRRGANLSRGRYFPLLLLVIVVSFIGWLASAVVGVLLTPAQSLGPGAQLTLADASGIVTAVILAPLTAAMFATAYLGPATADSALPA